MHIKTINTQGLLPALPSWVKSKRDGQYLAFQHGGLGRGQWQIRLALSLNDYDDIPPADEPYDLIRLPALDPAGQKRHFLAPGAPSDHRQLWLWDLEPRPGASATYSIAGACEIIAEGKVTVGEAGSLGFAPAPLVLVHGPCRLAWENPDLWVFEYDGNRAVLMTNEEKAA